jgi:hypothetical protein
VASDTQLLIRGATVVDPRDGSVRAGQDVHIDGETIVSVAPAADGDVPAAARVVDAAGQYLIPGFNDMHAHPLGSGDPSGSLDLMLAHGVTGFRQMSGSDRLLRDRAAGTLMPAGAPRLLAMPGTVLTPFNAGSAAAAAATVRAQRDLGADFIKAALVTSEVFYSAQQECRRLGIPILGHLPNGIDVARASGEGVRSVEHLGPGVSLLACCSSQPQAVRDAVAAQPTPRMPQVPPVLMAFLEPVAARMIGKLIINPLNRSSPSDVDLKRRRVPGRHRRDGQRGRRQARRPGAARCRSAGVGRPPAPGPRRGPGRPLPRPGGARRAQGEGRRDPIGAVTFSWRLG